MADYYRVKNQNIFNPPANTSLGNTTNQFTSVVVQNDLVLGNVTVTGSTIVAPRVGSITYPGNDTAADTAGGQTITLTGSGFVAGASVLINGSAVGVVSVVNSNSITFTSPAISTGSYVLYVINPDGSTAISVPGIQYSGTPTWTTAAGSLGSVYETASFNQTVAATGDAPVSYSVFSGTLPPGATFNSNGTITGTSGLSSSSTTYTFTVRATDAQLQDTDRSFSLTITPDVVTWSSPANNTTYSVPVDSAIANVTLSATSAVGSGITYSANTLPTGLSLTGAVISGTPTVVANTSSLLTATANTTSEISSRTINWVVSVANDPYFMNTVLALTGTSTTFVDDASTNNFGVTIFGDTKPNNSNPYTPGYYSNYFDGTGDYLITPTDTAFNFGTGDFTIECWVYLTNSSATTQTIMGVDLSASTGSIQVWYNNTANKITFNVYGNPQLVSSSNVSINNWIHLAFTRSSGTFKMFINGIQEASGALTNNLTNNVFVIGRGYASINAEYFYGYVSNLRVIKGTALYTSAFTPPTSPLTAIANTSLLTCQSNRFIDNSTNAFTITRNGDTSINSFDPFVPNSSYSTYGSAYFDGAGDYLNIPNNAALALGASNFTVECWLYLSEYNSSTSRIIDWRSNGGAGTNIPVIVLSASGVPTFYADVTTGILITGSSAIALNTWAHLAIVRSASTVTMYLNGVSIGSASSSLTLGIESLNINDPAAGSTYGQKGYITDVRIVKGTAVYTTTFTPPTAPLTAIANTSLLTLQNNQPVDNDVFLDSSTNNLLVTRAGNATQGTFSPYGANWSNYFTGSSYLNAGTTASNFLCTGSATGITATFEAWVFPIAYSTGASAWMFSPIHAKGATYFNFGVRNGAVRFYWFDGGYKNVDSTSTNDVPLNTWTHVAVTISASTIKIYVNGILNITSATYTGIATAGANQIEYIGVEGNVPTYFSGYISNYRLNNTVVYSAAFTPSTTPLTAIAGTNLLTCADNRFIDDSTNNFTITKNGDVSVQRFSPFRPTVAYSASTIGGSAYFDGTGDNLSLATATALGTGNTTVEFWFYPTSSSLTYRAIYDGRSTNDTNTGYSIFQYGLTIEVYGNGLKVATAASAFAVNTWVHVALVRTSGTCQLYINGVASGSTGSYSSNLTSTVRRIGDSVGTAFPFIGYISNLREVTSALYSGTFTPSTTPLTAITNTTLLLNNTSAGIIDNSMMNDLETVGDVKLSTAVTKFRGSSMFFDGTGDYLIYPDSPNQEFGSGNLTWEMWVNTTNSVQYTTLYSRTPTSFATGMWSLMMNFTSATTGDVALFVGDYSSGAPLLQTTGVSIRDGNWHHVAVVRSGSSWAVYVDGTSRATGTWAGTIADITAGVYVGADQYYGRAFAGYIDELRITKGVARYTSNFTPTTSALLMY